MFLYVTNIYALIVFLKNINLIKSNNLFSYFLLLFENVKDKSIFYFNLIISLTLKVGYHFVFFYYYPNIIKNIGIIMFCNTNLNNFKLRLF